MAAPELRVLQSVPCHECMEREFHAPDCHYVVQMRAAHGPWMLADPNDEVEPPTPEEWAQLRPHIFGQEHLIRG